MRYYFKLVYGISPQPSRNVNVPHFQAAHNPSGRGKADKFRNSKWRFIAGHSEEEKLHHQPKMRDSESESGSPFLAIFWFTEREGPIG